MAAEFSKLLAPPLLTIFSPQHLDLPALALAKAPDPAAIDRWILTSFTPQVRSSCHPILSLAEDYEITGYRIVGQIPETDLLAAIGVLDQAMVPLTARQIQQELTRLRVSTKARNEAKDDLTLRFQVLAEEIQTFPADVAVAACRNWAKREVFWPSLAELREEMLKLSKRRRYLRNALQAELRRKQKNP